MAAQLWLWVKFAWIGAIQRRRVGLLQLSLLSLLLLLLGGAFLCGFFSAWTGRAWSGRWTVSGVDGRGVDGEWSGERRKETEMEGKQKVLKGDLLQLIFMDICFN
jgi:hypothetical protein